MHDFLVYIHLRDLEYVCIHVCVDRNVHSDAVEDNLCF